MNAEAGLCAYAITRGHESDFPGTTLITHRGLSLVVSEVDLSLFEAVGDGTAEWQGEPAEDDPLVVLVRRHDDVVRAVFRHNPVLPLRFGTVLRDRDAALRLLEDRYEVARAWLDRVEDHREWGVRARRSGQPEPEPERPAEGLSGTEYLAMRGKRLAAVEASRRRGAEAADALHTALRRHATESAPRTRRAPDVVLDASYLVRSASEPAFRADLVRLAEHHGVAVEITGPWPPYSFTDLELSANGVSERA